MKIKNNFNRVLLDKLFPERNRVYENMLNDLFKNYEISSEFKSQKVSYNGKEYKVIPDSERKYFKFIYAFNENHIIDKSLFYLIPNVVVTHPLGVSLINNNLINNISKLKLNNLDLDYLDEQNIKKNGYINNNDIIIVFSEN